MNWRRREACRSLAGRHPRRCEVDAPISSVSTSKSCTLGATRPPGPPGRGGGRWPRSGRCRRADQCIDVGSDAKKRYSRVAADRRHVADLRADQLGHQRQELCNCRVRLVGREEAVIVAVQAIGLLPSQVSIRPKNAATWASTSPTAGTASDRERERKEDFSQMARSVSGYDSSLSWAQIAA